MRVRLGVLAVLVVGILVALPGPVGAQETDPSEGGTPDWRMVSAGRHHTCGIRTSGRLYCWGSDTNGQLGNGAGGTTDQPVEVAGGFTDWRTVSAGGLHTCGRRASGRIYCWGDDAQSQLGNGVTPGSQHEPVPVSGNTTTWTAVSAGESHTCALRSNRRLFCWGADGNGQLGNGPFAGEANVPTQVTGNRTDWSSVSAGGAHTCARRTTGRLYCWGVDDNGQLGNNAALTAQQAPVQVAGNRTDWAVVSAGVTHTCARRTTGRLFCWGGDNFGELGNGPTATGNRPTPVQVAGGRTDWASVSAGENHTCARRTTGRAFCWGRDAFGAVGDGQPATDRASPVQVAGNLTTWTAPEAGMNHTCARRTDRRLFCWGNDTDGQVGDGPTIPFGNAFSPTQVL